MIHPSSVIAPGAVIGEGVDIGPFCVVHDDVVIGPGTTIEAHCEIGHPTPRAGGKPLVIGPGSRIRSYSCFYAGSTFGAGLHTGHRVTVREGTQAGVDLQIGTLSDLQGTCRIGDHVRFHSNVHIGQLSTVEDFVWIFPYVVLTNDPHPPSEQLMGVTVERFAVIATMSVVLPGVRVGTGALVGAHSAVNRDVPPDTIVAGSPATEKGPASRVKLRDGSGRDAYPWRHHFHRGYPEDVVAGWIAAVG